MAGASLTTTGIPVVSGISFREVCRRAPAMWRGKFAFSVAGSETCTLEMAGSEWLIFQRLRCLAESRIELEWFECYGCPLVPRSLQALNAYMRTGAIEKFQSRRWDAGRELIGAGEWRRFCRMLNLKFDGPGTRQDAA